MASPDHGDNKHKALIDTRLDRAEAMLEALRKCPIPEETRTAFWKLSRVVGARSDHEVEVLDGLLCFLHRAIDIGLDPSATITAMTLHLEKETGRSMCQQDEEVDATNSAAGDRVMIHCLDSGLLWSDIHGWVRNPLEATTYDPRSLHRIEIPGRTCAVAEVAHVRDLFATGQWRIKDGPGFEEPGPRKNSEKG